VISYFDTSLLVKLYVQERDSNIAWVMANSTGVEAIISWLSEAEMAAAMAARFVRSSVVPQLDLAYAAFLREVSRGIFRVVAVDRSVFDLARSLGERYGGVLGVRALDVLHVAAAMRAGAEAFGTFDDRQGKLAKAVGMGPLG
jgi:predicted nucleic acid-binding protein